jgi:hypothetical protein
LCESTRGDGVATAGEGEEGPVGLGSGSGEK